MLLELHAGSPVILLPVSSQSPEILVADLGKLSVKNGFRYAGSEGTISSVRQQAKSAESSCDKTQLPNEIHHGNYFTVTRYSYSLTEYDQMLTYSSFGESWTTVTVTLYKDLTCVSITI
jgi:hypothetical protein